MALQEGESGLQLASARAALVQDARTVAETNHIVLQHLSERYRTLSSG